jgi:mRNA-degrading endonuclease RelE of RelBE toxin-antitoxin system
MDRPEFHRLAERELNEAAQYYDREELGLGSSFLQEVDRQLLHEPLKETRHRKPLRPNPVAPWELRVGQLRVFYEVTGVEIGVVRILAVGRKRRNALRIGGKEIRL